MARNSIWFRLIFVTVGTILLNILPAMAAGSPAEVLDDQVRTGNGEMRSIFSDIFRQASYGALETERAAFVVRGHEGFLCVMWPNWGGGREVRYTGVIPSGTIAIVHTHPGRQARASEVDRRQAERLGLPFYILSRRAIHRVEPRTGIDTEVVGGALWWNGTRRAGGSGCVATSALSIR